MPTLPPPSSITLALDAMGGDHGLAVTLKGADLMARRYSDVRFLLFGDEVALVSHLENYPKLRAISDVRAMPLAIRMDEKPAQALRIGRGKSSMWGAIAAVRDLEAHVAISAGNTGALMAMAKFCLKTLPQVERPAIAALWPTLTGRSIVLDVGASIGADAEHLIDMTLMGAAMAGAVLHTSRPIVGLLNIGVEDVKGLEVVREAGRLLRERPSERFDYHGFVEGDDIGKGIVDVVVTEGFSGNIALKTAEGTAKQISRYIRDALQGSWQTKLGYLIARPAFEALREKLDPRHINGGVFLGLEGLVVKSHGGTDAVGFASALTLAYTLARTQLIDTIRAQLDETILPAMDEGEA